MWIMMNDGFISVVENRYDNDTVFVRAREFNHLRNFIYPEQVKDIFSLAGSDYAYRIILKKEMFAELLVNQALKIDYDNFKNSVKDKKLKRFYSGVWVNGLVAFDPQSEIALRFKD